MSERNQRALATLDGFPQHWAATDEVKLAYVPKLLLVNRELFFSNPAVSHPNTPSCKLT